MNTPDLYTKLCMSGLDTAEAAHLMNEQNPSNTNKVASQIITQCNLISNLLIKKNEAYGNSVLNPIRIFSDELWEATINVRIDDKLSRIARGYPGNEDAELDLIGYLILKRVGKALEAVDHE